MAFSKEGFQIPEVLRELDGVLRSNAASMDDGGVMIYCTSCESFSAASQSYSNYVGRDMSKQKEKRQCVWCHGTHFVRASYDDLGALRMIYPHKAPETVIQGIEKDEDMVVQGIEKALKHAGMETLHGKYFSSGRDLTEVFASWLALSQEEKSRQVRELFVIQDRLARARIIRESAEEEVRAGHASLFA